MVTDSTTQHGVVKMGRLYGVGIGPGDPELITLKARHVVSQVPVIFVPRKPGEDDGMAQAILTALEPSLESKFVGVVLPMLRDRKKLREYWQQAADTILSHLSRGSDGAFVNVGDPLLYGTFIHVMRALQENHAEIEVEVIPGISSINAAAARAVVPLASDEDNIAVISGNQPEGVIRNALENFSTVVFMKVNTVFNRLLGILEEMNMKEKGIYIRRCTTEGEEIVWDIGSLKDERLDYFSLLIVRK